MENYRGENPGLDDRKHWAREHRGWRTSGRRGTLDDRGRWRRGQKGWKTTEDKTQGWTTEDTGAGKLVNEGGQWMTGNVGEWGRKDGKLQSWTTEDIGQEDGGWRTSGQRSILGKRTLGLEDSWRTGNTEEKENVAGGLVDEGGHSTMGYIREESTKGGRLHQTKSRPGTTADQTQG